MIVSGNQNYLQSSLAPLGDLLKALMFLSNLNDFNSSPSPPVQGFARQKGSSKVWKEKGSKWFCHFSLSLLVCVCALLRCFDFMFWVSLVLYFVLFNLFLFVFSFVLFLILKKIEKSEKYKNNVCFVYIGTCVPWMGIETKSSKLCIFCSLDEHFYAQLSKWTLWLVFVISMIKLSLVLNTRITLFDGKD